MDRYTLERGGVPIGTVIRGDWDGQQNSWPDWGWLELAEGFEAVGEILKEEDRLFDEVVRLQGDCSDAALAEAARVQADFMRPGVVLVPLADGKRLVLDEFHADAERVYWR